MKRSKLDQKLDRAVEQAVKETNAKLAAEGSDLMMVEARCPKCGCPDIDLNYPPQKGFKCWDCSEVYQTGVEKWDWA